MIVSEKLPTKLLATHAHKTPNKIIENFVGGGSLGGAGLVINRDRPMDAIEYVTSSRNFSRKA